MTRACLLVAAALSVAAGMMSCSRTLDSDEAFVRSTLDHYTAVDSVKQIVFVLHQGGSDAVVKLMEKRHGWRGDKWAQTLVCDAYVGKEGMGKTREGDGKTPCGDYGIIQAFGINPDPGTAVPYLLAHPQHYCCGDSVAYNRIIDIDALPHECAGEHLIDYVPEYNYGLFLDYNSACTMGRGSAIFMHCKGSKSYTGGCVAVDESDMIQILRSVDTAARVVIRARHTPRAEADNLSFVNPLIGTMGEGSQYGGMMPMAGVPFGSAQWVPMTRLTEVGILSYNESDSLLLGFIAARQPAIWMGEWGQVSFQPRLDAPERDYACRGQQIEEQLYTPYVGYVRAGGIETRYAALEHASVFEFSQAAHLVIDASRITHKEQSDPNPHPGHIEIGADGRSICGWNEDRFDAHHTSPKPNFKGYFYMELSRPVTASQVFGDGEDETQGYVTLEGGAEPLTVRVGLSLISVDQARENLRREVAGKSVAQVSKIARRKWEEKFKVLDIEAPDDVKTIFYTGLYHSLLYPRSIDEYGHYYSAFDDSIHEGVMYNCWSMWDTYRAEHPLLTLVAPERIDAMMQSLVEMYHEGGWLPKWPNPSYTGIMIGSPAETILAEAWTKGFRGFDIDEAYAAVLKNATVPQPTDTVLNWRDRGCFGDTPETRAGLTRYQTIGYVAGDEARESVSRTQDFGLQDLAAAVLADATGHYADAEYFRERSFNYRNLWNPEKMQFLPRSVAGEWLEPTRYDYCECSPHTALWCVPYDVPGVSELIGGDEEFERRLDEFFDVWFWKPERGNKSIHGNEPSHHIAYLYNLIGCPEKTQSHVREIMARSYSTNRKGFDGNEDCGQMSAWYILSSMGLYMLNPADGWYQLGSPCVESATLRIGRPYKPATLVIRTVGQAADKYKVARVSFNGREITDWRIHHSELIRGGELVFEFE